MIHTWSRESTATPDTCPSVHLAGTFGQNGSTWNVGAWLRCALACRSSARSATTSPPISATHTAARHIRFMGSLSVTSYVGPDFGPGIEAGSSEPGLKTGPYVPMSLDIFRK